MKKISILTTVGMAAASGLLAAVPAHAGVADGTLNNAHILTDIAALNTAINNDVQSVENRIANTRADGAGNSVIGQPD